MIILDVGFTRTRRYLEGRSLTDALKLMNVCSPHVRPRMGNVPPVRA